MILPARNTKFYLAKAPVDMRASYDRLFSLVKEQLKLDPYSGNLFVFLNSRRNMCKCILYDGTGLVLICKRLEKGILFSRLNPLYTKDIVLSQSEYQLFFEGAALNKGFIESPPAVIKNPCKAM